MEIYNPGAEVEWKETNQSHRHLKLEAILGSTNLTLSIYIQLTEFLTGIKLGVSLHWLI